MSLLIKRRRYLNIAFWIVCECENGIADLVLMTLGSGCLNLVR